MTEASLTGDALFAKVRAQLPLMTALPIDASESEIEAATGVSFTEAEKCELSKRFISERGGSVSFEAAGRDLQFAAARHRVMVNLAERYGMKTMGELPTEAFES